MSSKRLAITKCNLGQPDIQPITVIQIGLGPIGIRMISDVMSRENLKLTGAIDIDPKKIGRDVAEIAKLPTPTGITVRGPEALSSIPGDVCIVTTVSKFERLAPMLELCIKAGKHVVSTCEELSFPFETFPTLAKRIDALAAQHGVAVLGTGINPGFLMDTLPILLSGACKDVKTIRVERHQDSRIRRLPFQQKIGAGLTVAEWTKMRDAGRIKHVGFPQSISLIAATMGWELDYITESIDPVVAQEDVSSPLLRVPAGRCCGVRQVARGFVGGECRITLELCAYNGLKEPHDTVIIHGTPDIRSSIRGGVHGDISTSAIVCNCVKSVKFAKPGLRTMADIPVIHWLK